MIRSPSRVLLRRTALTLLMGTALAGCEVGPDYKSAPKIDLASYHNAAAVAARNESTPPQLDTWWTGFHDPELTRIVERALAQNLDLAASLGRVQQARAAAHEAGARLLPTGTLSADGTMQHQSLNSPEGVLGSHAPGYDRDQTLYDVGAGASWEIDLAGGLRRGAQAAGAEAQAAEDDHMGVRVSVAATDREVAQAEALLFMPSMAADWIRAMVSGGRRGISTSAICGSGMGSRWQRGIFGDGTLVAAKRPLSDRISIIETL